MCAEMRPPTQGDFWISKMAQGPIPESAAKVCSPTFEKPPASPQRAMLDVAMSFRAIPAPLWFMAALVPMAVSQIVRLEQSDPATWIAWDYGGRVGALAVLGAIPSARIVTFQWERLLMTYWQVASWIVGIVLFDHYVCGWLRRTLNAALPATVLGGYPETHGWLHIVDAVFGLALVAYSEEVVFRRCARHLFQFYLNDGYALIVVTSLLFGAYHWWTGVVNLFQSLLLFPFSILFSLSFLL